MAGSAGGAGDPAPSEDELRHLEALGYVDWHRDQAPGQSGVTLYDRERASPGYNLYTNDVDEVYLEDLAGERVHTWRVAGRSDCEYAELLADGGLAVVCMGEALVVLEWDSSVRWQYEAPVHHDVALLPGGGFLVAVRGESHWYRARRMLFDDIVELSPTGAFVRRWSSFDALDEVRGFHPPTALDAWASLGSMLEAVYRYAVGEHIRTYDYYHLNSIEVLTGAQVRAHEGRFRPGNVLVSLRNVGVVMVLDWEDFSILWHWGGGVLEMQHMPTMLDDGHVLIFDNGTHRGHSRVVELDVASGEIVWSYAGDPPESFLSKWQGSAQRLPNGNTLICNSDRGRAFEVTPAGETVWEFWSRDVDEKRQQRRGIYRLLRLPPAFVEQAMASGRAREGSGDAASVD